MIDARPMLEPILTQEDFDAIALAVAAPYKACADFMRLNVVTSTFPIGMEQKPHLLRAFVDHSLMQMANYRDGFFHEMRWNEARNCQHVRVFKGKLAITAHFMGRTNFRHSARQAECRSILAMRNGDLFAHEANDLDVSKDGGYVQILHGGNASPEFLMLVIPSRDQSSIPAGMELVVPKVDPVSAEKIREEMALKIKSAEGGESQNGHEALG
jgi:hypothetical protein